jgi:uncharacterized protein (DUF4415 family)
MKKLSAERRRRQIQAIRTLPDDRLDTSDIPELTEEQMIEGVRGRFYWPVKRPVTMRLDADTIEWLQKDGPGYQTKANRLLRTEMLRSCQAAGLDRSMRKRRAK